MVENPKAKNKFKTENIKNNTTPNLNILFPL